MRGHSRRGERVDGHILRVAQLIMDNGQHVDIDVVVWTHVATQTFQLDVVQIGTLPVEALLKRDGSVGLGERRG